MRTVYLDYNATTPLDPTVREAMQPFLGEIWGNPSSVHHVGRRARALLDDGRDRVSNILSCKPSEIVFTSGGTESINLAILGTARKLASKGRHIVTSRIEHHAVLHACAWLEKHEQFQVTYVPVDRFGRVDSEAVTQAIRAETVLVSIMAANNEIGTIQPIAEIGACCRKRGVIFHTDAVQWFGKEPVTDISQFNADLISICCHKFYGPKGAGVLYIRSPLQLEPILFGGGHENERRAGTENLASIMGLAESIDRFVRKPVFEQNTLYPLRQRLTRVAGSISGIQLVGPAASTASSGVTGLANTVSFVVERSDSMALMAGLDLEGICASSGSACSAGSLEPSHVIQALGLGNALANALVRFSLGRETTEADINHVEEVLPMVVRRAQRP